jgi:hypothetical protein
MFTLDISDKFDSGLDRGMRIRPIRGRRTRTRTRTILDGDADVEAEAVTHAVEEPAHSAFGGGVLAPNAAHVPGAAFFGEAVAHNNNNG